MVAFRRVLLAVVGIVLVAGACTSIPNIPSIPPIPPINLPGGGGNLPSIPPINIPGFTIPPINIPGFTIPPIDIGNPSSTPCTLVTAAEVGQILGGTVTDESSEATDCSFLLPNFSAVSVQTTSDTDLQSNTVLMGNTAQQLTIGGYPALAGVIFGQPVIFVQKPSGQAEVLGVLTGTDPATMTKLEQIATIAVGRMP